MANWEKDPNFLSAPRQVGDLLNEKEPKYQLQRRNLFLKLLESAKEKYTKEEFLQVASQLGFEDLIEEYSNGRYDAAS